MRFREEAEHLKFVADLEEQQCENWRSQAEESESEIELLKREVEKLESEAEARWAMPLALVPSAPASVGIGGLVGAAPASGPATSAATLATAIRFS